MDHMFAPTGTSVNEKAHINYMSVLTITQNHSYFSLTGLVGIDTIDNNLQFFYRDEVSLNIMGSCTTISQ